MLFGSFATSQQKSKHKVPPIVITKLSLQCSKLLRNETEKPPGRLARSMQLPAKWLSFDSPRAMLTALFSLAVFFFFLVQPPKNLQLEPFGSEFSTKTPIWDFAFLILHKCQELFVEIPHSCGVETEKGTAETAQSVCDSDETPAGNSSSISISRRERRNKQLKRSNK